MTPPDSVQNDAPFGTAPLRVGVDVGGTFTDLVAWDGAQLRVVKLPSSPPAFERAVIDAVSVALTQIGTSRADVVHGSTVATNALLERKGEPIALVTTDGFADLLLIGRQNRPRLYALHVERPAALAGDGQCFTLRERVDARGDVVTVLDPAEVEQLADRVLAAGLRHAAVCLLFSFANPEHERLVAQDFARRGITTTLSSDLLPEFREYERASTTAVNASLRPRVQDYLTTLAAGLPGDGMTLRVMHSGGGTLSVKRAATHAARLVLSGPAGGAIGAAYVARAAGFDDVITYDMGGTSTDVATILGGRPQWTTGTAIDGLPVALPMFDIHTVGAGGGSVAYVDAGGALRVGPRSAGATPGPACYGRGGDEPTVTDANLVLGRIPRDARLGGSMPLRPDLAEAAVGRLAGRLNLNVAETALGILRVVEGNMVRATRAVSSRRGHDPRRFALVSFGGAGGLHACAVAGQLEIGTVIVPPLCGVLSALGMVVAPEVVDVSQSVLHLGDALDDDRLAAEYGSLNARAMDELPRDRTAATEVWADARVKGQSHELKVRVHRPSLAHVADQFRATYEQHFATPPPDRPVEVTTLRIRRLGPEPRVTLPPVPHDPTPPRVADVVDEHGISRPTAIHSRAQLPIDTATPGPLLLLDAEATTYVPAGWAANRSADGTVLLRRG
jgi:N-methylhydantoinase A